jgi:hypothetical protein
MCQVPIDNVTPARTEQPYNSAARNHFRNANVACTMITRLAVPQLRATGTISELPVNPVPSTATVIDCRHVADNMHQHAFQVPRAPKTTPFVLQCVIEDVQLHNMSAEPVATPSEAAANAAAAMAAAAAAS